MVLDLIQLIKDISPLLEIIIRSVSEMPQSNPNLQEYKRVLLIIGNEINVVNRD